MSGQTYVFLSAGDVIQEGDEIFNYMGHWATIKESIGNKAKSADVGFIRRAVDLPMQTLTDTVCTQLRQVGDAAMTTNALTKREWFAGMALNGLTECCWTRDKEDQEEIAKRAFGIADAMIKAGKETE